MSAPSRGSTSRPRRVIAPRGPGRRSQAERTQRQQDEQARTHAREAEYAHELNEQRLAAEKAERARQRAQAGRSRGGRGGFMGDAGSSSSSSQYHQHRASGSGTTAAAEPQARSGPLSEGSAVAPGRNQTYPRNWAPSKRGRAGSAKRYNGVKREGEDAAASGGQQTQRTDEQSGTSGSDEDGDESDESGGPRVDVDYINLISDDEGSDSSQTARARFAPVRVDRVPHRDRAPQINPDASSTIKKQEDDVIHLSSIPLSTSARGKQRAKDVEIIEVSRPWRGVYEDEQVDRIIKSEPASPPATTTTTTATASNEPPIPAAGVSVPAASRTATKKRQPRTPVFSTDEDKQEWERHHNELRTMVDELGLVDPKPPPETGGAADTMQDKLVDKKEDRVYLFQFPPVVPNLSAKSAMQVDPPDINASDQTKDDKKNIAMQPANGRVEEVVTVKDDLEARKKDQNDKDTDHLPNLQSGRVGKLRVFKSGKATLDWGGTSLQLNMGTSPFFLQDSVMVKMNPASESAPEDEAAASSSAVDDRGETLSKPTTTGEAFAFGQVRGKFIVTPDWDEVLEKF